MNDSQQATELQLVGIAAYTDRQEAWARDMRLRIYADLVLRFGKEHRATIIAACNQYRQWYQWTLEKSGTKAAVIEAIEQALAKQAQEMESRVDT
jgi:hypothetical protein